MSSSSSSVQPKLPARTASLMQAAEKAHSSNVWLGRFEVSGIFTAALTGAALLAHYVGGANLSPIYFKATLLIGQIAGSITALFLILGVGSYVVNKKTLKNITLEAFLDALRHEPNSEELFKIMTKSDQKEVFQKWSEEAFIETECGKEMKIGPQMRLAALIKKDPEIVASNLMFISPEFLHLALIKCNEEQKKELKRLIKEKMTPHFDSVLDQVLDNPQAELKSSVKAYELLTLKFGIPNEKVLMGKELALWAGEDVSPKEIANALTLEIEPIFANLRAIFEIGEKMSIERAGTIINSRALELQAHFKNLAQKP